MRGWAPRIIAACLAVGCSGKVSDTKGGKEDDNSDGTTAIDLSDSWSPYLFSRATHAGRFKETFVALANERPVLSPEDRAVRRAYANRLSPRRRRSLSEQIEISAPRHPYLSVYGIPPTLSVLKRRATEEVSRPCFDNIDYDAIAAFHGFLAYTDNPTARTRAAQGRKLAETLSGELSRHHYATLSEYRANTDDPKKQTDINAAIEYRALEAAQRQLVCEGLLKKDDIINGGLGHQTHLALRRFERKNHLFGWGYFGPNTVAALSKRPKARLYDALVHVITERVVDAAGIIEDGSVGKKSPETYLDQHGMHLTVRDLTAEYTEVVLRHLKITSVDSAVRFLRALDTRAPKSDSVRVRLPTLPPYYEAPMVLSIEIRRGDVYYDYPYDGAKKQNQKRQRLSMLQLFVTWRGQKVKLAEMNTSIGGWQNELAPDGYVYLKYKPSLPGERIIKHIIAAPTWMPPQMTPPQELMKTVLFKRRHLQVPNLNAVGPWYASAYGLVAAVHLRKDVKGAEDFVDDGVRSHGTHDYTSITKRYSHGCHRLHNHLALRLYDFILRHTPHRYLGRRAKEKVRRFQYDQKNFKIEVASEGEVFELDRPIPVETSEGTIKGDLKRPIERYMPRPDIRYGKGAMFVTAD